MNFLCKYFKVSRSGYYRWKAFKSRPSRSNKQKLIVHIREIFTKSKGVYGSPRVHAQLKKEGVNCSRRIVAEIMHSEGLFARRVKRRVFTTDSRHGHCVSHQRYKVHDPSTHPEAPYEVWAGDITYLLLDGGKFVYLSVVMDLFDRRIVGWHLSEDLSAECVVKALDMAFSHEGHPKELIFHSDRGVQYTSLALQELLESHSCQSSMSRKGNFYDSAYVESFFKTLKIEMFSKSMYETRDELRSGLFSYMAWYNRERLHSSLSYKSPLEHYQSWLKGDLDKKQGFSFTEYSLKDRIFHHR